MLALMPAGPRELHNRQLLHRWIGSYTIGKAARRLDDLTVEGVSVNPGEFTVSVDNASGHHAQNDIRSSFSVDQIGHDVASRMQQDRSERRP
jgi:hypothetical protein